MNTRLTPSKTISRSTHKVVANFTNGFAQHVIELDDGTVLFINYHETEVEVVKTEPLTDPSVEVPAIVNATVDNTEFKLINEVAVNSDGLLMTGKENDDYVVVFQNTNSDTLTVLFRSKEYYGINGVAQFASREAETMEKVA